MAQVEKLILGSEYEGKKAQKYEEHRWNQKVWRRETEALERMILVQPRPRSATDVPCGTGRLFGLWTKMNISVHAVDVSHVMLALAKMRSRSKKITLAQDSILNVKKDTDLIACVRLLHLVDEASMRRIVNHILPLARHRVVLTIPLGDVYTQYGDTARHDEKKFRTLVKRLDFEIAEEEDVSGRGRVAMRLERVSKRVS